MQTRQRILLGLMGGCAVALFAQTLPRDLPPIERPGYQGGSHSSEPAKRVFRFQGKQYVSVLTQRLANPNQEWQLSAPLPLSFGRAEQIARAELQKFVRDDSEWEIAEICVSRFRAGLGWYYAVTFSPELYLGSEPADSFVVLVDFSGRPGFIGRSSQPVPQR